MSDIESKTRAIGMLVRRVLFHLWATTLWTRSYLFFCPFLPLPCGVSMSVGAIVVHRKWYGCNIGSRHPKENGKHNPIPMNVSQKPSSANSELGNLGSPGKNWGPDVVIIVYQPKLINQSRQSFWYSTIRRRCCSSVFVSLNVTPHLKRKREEGGALHDSTKQIAKKRRTWKEQQQLRRQTGSYPSDDGERIERCCCCYCCCSA